MHKIFVFVLVILSQTLLKVCGQNVPGSPCPNIFQYSYERSEWFGIAQIQNPPASGQPIKLIVFLSLKVPLPTEYIGSLELLDSRQESLQNIRDNLPIRYRIRFPPISPLPKVAKIVLNNWVICHGPPETGFYVTEIRLEHTLYTPLLTQPPQPPPTPSPVQKFLDNVPNDLDDSMEDNSDEFYVDAIEQPEESFVENFDQPTVQTIFRPWQIVQLPNRLPIQMYPEAMVQPSYKRIQNNEDTCGRPLFQLAHFLVGGQDIAQGSWPWLVAIFINRPIGPEYVCSGTLISSKVVITAAHCLMINERRRTPNEIVISLSNYANMRWGGPKTVEKIESIIIHRDFQQNGHTFDADIAILIVKNRIQYTKLVRPICLPDETTMDDRNSTNEGTVVIWSRDGNDNFNSIKPQLIDVPIVSDEECMKQGQSYSYISSNRTFCGGGQDGRGPCYGDSGSGLAIRKDSRWFLKGIVSGGLNDPTCATGSFVVFTDATRFLDFIKPYKLL